MLKRFILWDYPRASWQYDVMVALILAFVFLTPREWFRDQPRLARASTVAMLPSEPGSSVFWLDRELLSGVPESGRAATAGAILLERTGNRRLAITRVQPVADSEDEIQGYLAFARP